MGRKLDYMASFRPINIGAGFAPAHRGGAGPPLLVLHGFTDTWRTWEPVLPMLERRFEVLAPTLAGHAGGPPLGGDASDEFLVDAVETALDQADWEAPRGRRQLARRLRRAAPRRARTGAEREGWRLDAERIDCPERLV
jgi:hypothetical protein